LRNTETGVATHDNATGVFYNENLWIFYPTEDSSDNELHYKKFDGEDLSDGHTLEIDGDTQNTKAQISPVVADKLLYVFFTGKSGTIHFTYKNAITDDWNGLFTVENDHFKAVSDPDHRCAAVYNSVTRCIEVYWSPDESGEIHYTYHAIDNAGYPAGHWKGGETIPGSLSSAGNYSAVFYETGEGRGETLLAFRDRNSSTGHVHHIIYDNPGGQNSTDFVVSVQKTDTNIQWDMMESSAAPYLVDLGEEKIAIIWKGCHTCQRIYRQYYSKSQCQWIEHYESTMPDANNWSPTGGVYYEKKKDDKNTDMGYRWDAVFYVFYGDWVTGTLSEKSKWKMTSVEDIGYWWPVDHQNLDFAEADMVNDTFYLWPMIALVDSPPFVLNGWEQDRNYCNRVNCTEVSVGKLSSDKTMMSGEFTVGPYVETGHKCPLTFELSMGISGSRETSTTYEVRTDDVLSQNLEGYVMAFYLAPKFTISRMEWYRASKDSSGNITYAETGIYAYPMKVTGGNIQKQVFLPEEGPFPDAYMPEPSEIYLDIPTHGSEDDRARLNTYKYAGDMNPANFPTYMDSPSRTWATSSPALIDLKIKDEEASSIGCYAECKVGFNLKQKFGAGIEGSFDFSYTVATEEEDNLSVDIYCPDADTSNPEHVTHFTVQPYWLKANKDGYWIPEYRNKAGDAPSFVTFSVSNVQPPVK
jgi:hypothetical protein